MKKCGGGDFVMQNLLKAGKVVKEEGGLKVELYQLSGEARPKINEINTYRWALLVRGNNRYPHIEALRVDFSFVNQLDTAHVELEDYIPRREEVEKANLTLSVVPQIISVNIPISHEKIRTERSASKIEWIFNNIKLSESETMSKVFEGVVSARFFPESIDKRITISMNVIPIFCKKKIPFRMNPCPSPPKIEAKEVKENCTEIIPGDPERGYAGFDRPDNERFLTYRYIIDQGILEKGTGKEAIRNVSLRAKTLSTFFDKLRRNMPLSDDLYHKNMKAVGREIGADFVNELETILSRKPTLEEWSDYDASAGMGRFKIIDKKKIVAKNSFNAYKNPSDKPVCVCSFLEGYFEGILKEIWGTTVIVTEISCIGKGDKECVFKIEEK
jgi:predicted hydrocarbon binding protein